MRVTNSTETLSGCFAFHKSTLLANVLQSQFREELVPGPELSERGKNCMLRAGLAPVIYSEDSETEAGELLVANSRPVWATE